VTKAKDYTGDLLARYVQRDVHKSLGTAVELILNGRVLALVDRACWTPMSKPGEAPPEMDCGWEASRATFGPSRIWRVGARHGTLLFLSDVVEGDDHREARILPAGSGPYSVMPHE